MHNHMRTFTLLAAMTALFAGVGLMLGGVGGMLIAFLVAVAINAYSYWNADKIVLKAYRARPAEELSHNAVVRNYLDDTRELAARAGMPEPKICVIDIPQPNAFATGRDPQHAAVCATTGLLRMLDRDEIRGVMAHELAHVKNRDTLTMTVTATIAGAIGMLAQFAFFLGGGRDRGGALAMIVIMILAPLAASVVQMAISRAREYEADRVGGEIAGDPLALARALAKIEQGARRVENAPAEDNPAMAHLFIVNPLNGKRADNLFSTHPATANRIAKLEDQARIMGRQPQRETVPPAQAAASAWPTDEQNRGPWG